MSRRVEVKSILAAAGLLLGCQQAPQPGGTGGLPPSDGGSSSGGLSSGGAASGGVASGGSSSGGESAGGTAVGGTATGGTGAAGGANGGGAGGLGAGGTACEEFVMPDDCSVPEGAVLPAELRCTGLYEDMAARALRCDVLEYSPAYPLYSDTATKFRYVSVPAGTQLKLDNPDDFIYPVGTRFWKEFWVGPSGAQTLGETRFLLKTDLGWTYTTYVWNEGGTTAVQENEGVADLFGSGHTVPSREQCKSCHVGRQDYVLGWDAVLLGSGEDGAAAAEGLTLQTLEARGLLADSPGKSAALAVKIPGSAVERDALAYLHVNCGVSCHNQNVNATGKPSGLFLRLEAGELATPQDTDAVTSGTNRSPGPNAELVGLPDQPDGYYDFRPLDPARSLVTARMNHRGSPTAMPPLGTQDVDGLGLATVRAWIEAMTEELGYPAAGP